VRTLACRTAEFYLEQRSLAAPSASSESSAHGASVREVRS
jgi:hypothetical protein